MSKVYSRTLTLPDGRRKFFRASTVKEAERLRDEAREQIARGLRVGDNTTVAELARIWFDTYKKGQLHIRSEETIKGILDRYIIPRIGWMAVKDVLPVHIQQVMVSVKDYSKSTQKKVLQNMKAIFTMAEENGFIQRSPVRSNIKAKGADPEEKKPLTHAQTDALLKAIRETRAYPLVLVLLYGGLRIGEALGLLWSDIDFENGTISVKRSIVYPAEHPEGIINRELKTDAAERTIPVPMFVVNYLWTEMRRSKSAYVFSMQNGKHLSASSYRALWRLVETRTIGKTDTCREFVERTLDFNVHPHLLRHTCITRWFEAGLDVKEVQYLAGHASPDITLGIYTHYMAEERHRETAAKIRAAN